MKNSSSISANGIKKETCAEQCIPVKLPYAGSLRVCETVGGNEEKQRNKNQIMKYSKKEILEIIKANHKQRLQFEKGFPKEEEITYELSIRNWIDDMELLELSLIHI